MFQARYYKDFASTERAWPPTNVQTPEAALGHLGDAALPVLKGLA